MQALGILQILIRKIYVKTYRECTGNLYSFLTINTIPASDLLKFRKIFFACCKDD